VTVSKLWEHQKVGVSMIERQEATLLADDMGAGKSRNIVEYVRRHRPTQTLILCPKSVVTVWPRQFETHAPGEKVHVVPLLKRRSSDTIAHRVEYARQAFRAARQAGWPLVLVVNLEAACLGAFREAFLKVEWDLVVIDEIHRIKAAGGQQSKWAARLGLKAKKRVGLTGTPMPHSPLDVYGQFRFLDPSIYGVSYVRFRNRYAVMGGYSHNGRPMEVVAFKNLDELHDKFYSISRRVMKEDVMDMPDQIHEEIEVEMGPEAQRVYRELEKEFVAQIKAGTITIANALAKVVRLQQVAAGFTKLDGGGEVGIDKAKQDRFVGLVEDMNPKEPVAVFAFFKHNLKQIHEAAERLGRPCRELSGSINEIGSLWKPQPGEIAAIQMQSGGLGIDLTAGRYAAYFDQTYSLGDYEQTLDRLHRPGQRNNVTYFHLLSRDTIDFKIRKALVNRQRVIESVIKGLTHQ